MTCTTPSPGARWRPARCTPPRGRRSAPTMPQARLPELRERLPSAPERVWQAAESVDQRGFAVAAGALGATAAAAAAAGARTGGRSASAGAPTGSGLHGSVRFAQAAAARGHPPGSAATPPVVLHAAATRPAAAPRSAQARPGRPTWRPGSRRRPAPPSPPRVRPQGHRRTVNTRQGRPPQRPGRAGRPAQALGEPPVNRARQAAVTGPAAPPSRCRTAARGGAPPTAPAA